MYNLHNYIEKKLLMVTENWKYTDIKNFGGFLLLELEEMETCMYRVVAANAGIRL